MATKTKKPRPRRPPARWKAGMRFNVRAAVAAAELERIRRSHGGSLVPSAVVDEARDPGNPLHKVFTWDDTAAAERWREQQARCLINSVRVVVQETGRGERQRVAYLSVVTREVGRAYIPVERAMADAEYREASLAEALAALRGWRLRHRHLTELSDVFDAIDRAARRAARPKRKAA